MDAAVPTTSPYRAAAPIVDPPGQPMLDEIVAASLQAVKA